MPRVTDAQLRQVVTVEATDAAHFIDTAHLIVDEQLVNKGMSDARLQKIELYLAAHFVTITERQVKSEGLSGVTITYTGQTGQDYASSLHGQTAMNLDTSGTLRESAKRASTEADFKVVKTDGS